MGYAHHSLRDHPIVFAFAETGSSPLYIKLIKKEKATKVKRIFPEFKTKREVFDEKVYKRLLSENSLKDDE